MTYTMWFRWFCILLVFCCVPSADCSADSRPAAVAGKFYPENPSQLSATIDASSLSAGRGSWDTAQPHLEQCYESDSDGRASDCRWIRGVGHIHPVRAPIRSSAVALCSRCCWWWHRHPCLRSAVFSAAGAKPVCLSAGWNVHLSWYRGRAPIDTP
jgi:hypothetical protein